MTQQNQQPDEQHDNLEQRAVQILDGIIGRMGYDDLRVEARTEDGRLELEIVGDEVGDLVGEKGATLDALQFVLGRILQKEPGGRRPLNLDNAGYRKRRNEALAQMANELADKANELGQTVAINPMSAHDRRIIHMTLRDVPKVSTQSEGEGTLRRVLIIPQP